MVFAIPAWHFGVAPCYFCAVGLGLIWLWRRLNGEVVLKDSHLWAIRGYVLLSLFSILLTAALPLDQLPLGGDKRPWVFGATQWCYLAWTLGGFLLIVQFLRRHPELIRPVLRAHLSAATAVSFWGLYQCLSYAFGWPYPTWFNNNLYRYQNYEQVFGGLRRISGTAPEPADFALYLLTAVPLLLLTRGGKGLLPRVWGMTALFTCTLTLCLTTSLSAYLGLLLTAVWILGNLRELRLGALFAALLLTGITVMGLSLAADLGSTTHSLLGAVETRIVSAPSDPDASLDERGRSLIIAGDILRDHPWIGVGEGNYSFAAYQHHAPGAGYQIPRIFSLGARILCEHGITGAALFLVLLLQLLRLPAPGTADPTLLAGLRSSVAVGVSVMLVSSADIDHYALWLMAAVLVALPSCRTAPLHPPTHVGQPQWT